MIPMPARRTAVAALAIASFAVLVAIALAPSPPRATHVGGEPPGTLQPDTAADMRSTFGSLSATAHRARLQLLRDNVDAWAARWRLIATAEESIDIDYFIFSQDLFGRALLGHLLEKARQGVRVRLQLDAQGMIMAEQPEGTDCLPFVAHADNFKVRIHRRLRDRIVEALLHIEPTLATASDHDKILVVDARFSVVGGRNIEAKYFAHPDDLPEAFHDADAVLESGDVGEVLTGVFERTFGSGSVTQLSAGGSADAARCSAALRVAYEAMDAWLRGRPFDPSATRPEDGADVTVASELARYRHLKGVLNDDGGNERVAAEVRVLDSVPRAGSDRDPVTRGLARLFRATSRQILMETPYLVLTEPAADMLKATSERGVDITLLTNSPRSTDNALSQVYFREQWPRLLATVPSLRLYASGTTHNVHSKLALFDNQVTLLGSYNLDPFSMLVSGEIMIAVWSREFAEQVGARARAMIERGAPAVYEYRIERDAGGEPVRNSSGDPVIAFGPADHTEAEQGPLRGFRWALLRAVPWLAGLPPFF